MVTTGDGIPQNPVDVTLSGATAVGYSSAGRKTYWLAYGIQQWGATTSPTEDVTYPIPVSRVLCLLLTTRATTFRYSPWPTKITTKSFQAVSDSEPAYWFLVAKQQWGKSLTAESKASVTFPIAFERIVYFVDVFSLDAGRPCLFTKSHPITTNGFYWEYNYHGDDVGVQWLAIGV